MSSGRSVVGIAGAALDLWGFSRALSLVLSAHGEAPELYRPLCFSPSAWQRWRQ